MNIPPLKLSKLPYPHISIGLVCFKEESALRNSSRLDCLAQENEIFLLWKGRIGIFSSQKIEDANVNSLFSGIAFSDNRLIFGSDDFIEENNLKDAYGEFSLLKFSEERIELSADYFGYGKWYYYEDDNIFSASTSYHLLLLILVASGAQLEMNIERSRVNLSQIGFGFTFGQQFSRQMDVRNSFVKMANENIIFHLPDRRLELEKTNLLEFASISSSWDESVYEDYMRKGREEICSNLHSVLKSPHFDRVVIDLSGGFDSRVVYAAMTTLPKEMREKVLVYIRNSHVSDDVQIAHAVNNCYGYEVVNSFDQDTSDIFDENGRIDLHNISSHLGGYSQLPNMKKYDANSRYIEIMGGGGDILFGFNRVYGDYAKFLSKYSDDEVIVNKISSDDMLFLRGTCASTAADAKKILTEVLSEFPDNIPIFQKLHLLYLLFRNNNHFSAFKYQNNLLTLNVLHSKWALKAKWLYWSRFGRNDIPPEKVSVDMLNLMNPLIAQIPFAKENDAFLPEISELQQPVKISIEADFEQKPYRYLNKKASTQTYSLKARDYIWNIDNALDILKLIEEYDCNYSDLVSELKIYLNKEKIEPSKNFPFKLINKIFHVGYEIKIVQQSTK